MIILLNGTSSAGKTTIARVLQEQYPGVLLLYGVDSMVQTVFPAKCDFPPFDEQAIKLNMTEVDGRPQANLEVSSYMYPVYETAIRYYKMLSEQGYNLIVDEVLFDANRVTPYFEILAGETVYFIAVKPEKDVVVRRERERGDRLPGLAEGLYDKVYHPLFTYDLILDTGKLTPDESAEQILACLERDESPRGFLNSAIAWRNRKDLRS